MQSQILKVRADIQDPETGIDNRKKVAANMASCLSDSYLLMVKTQGYHWNVVGPLFRSIHLLTEDHYNNLFEAIDELAERIRALGYPSPSSVTEMIALSAIEEDTENPTAEEMIDNLARDHGILARRFRECISRAEEADDVVSADMLTRRIEFHEKAIWMLTAVKSE
ncbi:DNA starvation/stationary phase protection protein [Hoeflea sp. WL0058]|uniref:DNA starvation/stationary phase protection protein n=1 Tax=Flavimaribacter sediminis TaxID=2865987 RepID=A0AAE2ZL64_9HYPH|nr:DNA starvation/stationary phase protection protein [Flavimaribacter sediminis]MBW8636675.1 DNA starvation/stationary phase protection protein [Flavimaribacter sediminis]